MPEVPVPTPSQEKDLSIKGRGIKIVRAFSPIRISRIRDRFFPKQPTTPELFSPELGDASESPEAEEAEDKTSAESNEVQKPHSKNTEDALAERLKGEDVTPPEFENKGVAAIIGTNETVIDGFFEAVRAKRPDGYIVGVGAGNVFSLLHCFSEEASPKGIVLADVDPRVIAIGKMVVAVLKESETAQDFRNKFFKLSDNEFQAKLKEVISSEENAILQQRLEKITPEEWSKIAEGIRRDAWNTDYYETSWERQPFREGVNIDVATAMLDKFEWLKHLAVVGNMAIVYADFTNPALIEAVKGLPDFQDSRNVIYLSNIADHITNRGSRPENVAVMGSLRAYEDSTKGVVFIDTLQKIDYFLRVRSSLPAYLVADLRVDPLTLLGHSVGKRSGREYFGLLFADEAERELRETDLAQLNNEELYQRYLKILSNRLYQERKTHQEQYGYSFEDYYLPAWTKYMFEDRRSYTENPVEFKKLNGGIDWRELQVKLYGEAVVQMMEVYAESIGRVWTRVWRIKGINMWGKPLDEVIEALRA